MDMVMNTTLDKNFKHGRNGYIAHRCRCNVCRMAVSKYLKQYKTTKKETKAWLDAGFNHGVCGYNLGCRCDVCKECSAKSRVPHKAKHIKRSRAHYIANREVYRENAKKYAKIHHKELQAAKRVYERNKWHNEPQYKIRCLAGHRIRMALKGISKSGSTAELIGCSMIELRKHLESQFKIGMSWDNYGKGGWHIDHIRPCSSFNLNDVEQQKLCFNWTNLQPLWASENLSKGDSYAA